MKLRDLSLAVLVALSSSPVLAQADRVSNRVGTSDAFGGDSTLLLILAVILIGAGIYALASNNSDTPSSP